MIWLTTSARAFLATLILAGGLVSGPNASAEEIDIHNDPVFDVYRKMLEQGKQAPPKTTPVKDTSQEEPTKTVAPPVAAPPTPPPRVPDDFAPNPTPRPTPPPRIHPPETVGDQPAAALPVVAVMDFKSRDLLSLPKILLTITLNRAIESAQADAPRVRLLDAPAIEDAMVRENLVGDDPFRPTIENRDLAKALKADYLVLGAVGKNQDHLLMTISLYDTREDATQVVQTKILPSTAPQALFNAMPEVADHLLAVWQPASEPTPTPQPTPPAPTVVPVPRVRPTPAPPGQGLTTAPRIPEGRKPINSGGANTVALPLATEAPPPVAPVVPTPDITIYTPTPAPTPTDAPAVTPAAPTPTPEAPIPPEERLAAALAMKHTDPRRLFHLETLVEAFPDNMNYRRYLAETAIYIGRVGTEINPKLMRLAVDNCQKVLGKYPMDDSTLTIKGIAHYNLDEFDKAIDSLRKALLQNPQNIEAQYNLGHSYATYGDLLQAKKEFERYLSLTEGMESQAPYRAYVKRWLEAEN